MVVATPSEMQAAALPVQVGVQVLALALRDARSTAEQFGRLMADADRTVQAVVDPRLGRYVDIRA